MKQLTRAIPLVALVGFLVLIGLVGCPATSEGLSDQESVAAAKTALVITYAQGDSETSVTQDMTLPATGASGTTISWTSSDTNVITNNGTVTRPAADETVTLTATITKNDESDTKTFTLTVPKMSQADDSAPGKPTNVQAVAGNARVTITWAAPTDKGTVSGAAGTITGYKIYYSKNNPVTTSDTSVEVSDTTTLTQDVESLTNGTAYYFAVTASNGSGEGDLSNQASATPVAGKQDLASMQLSYPAITMDFGATSGNTASPSWTVPADDVDYSIASRPQGANSGNVTIDTNTGEVTATINAASADSGDYTIEATAKTGSTSYTGTQTATLTLTITKQTGKPTSVSATPGNEKVTLSWTAPDAGYSGSTVETIQGYKIYHSTTSGATGTLIDKSSVPSTSVEITGLTNGTTYYFRVQAVTDQGDGELSDEANGTPQSVKIDLSTLKPGYPETHTHTYVPASTPKTEITPTWVVPDSEVTYSFSARPHLSENAHVHIDFDTGIVTIEAFALQWDGGTYTVKAAAVSGSTRYVNSAEATFTLTVNAKPDKPRITSATPTDAGGIDLAWTLPTETGYSGTTPEALTALEITINPAPTSGATRSVSASATTETITGLASGTAYSFTMTASNIHGKSTASNEKSATTKSDLSTATLSYAGALEKVYGSAAITSNPSWAGGPDTPASPTYSIAAATTGTPTEDGTTLSGNGISINTDGVITVGTAVEVKHSGDYVVTATAAKGDGNYIVGTTATLTVPVTVSPVVVTALSGYSDISATVGTAITDQTGSTTPGGATGAYSISPALPGGLNLTPTGTLSGNPDTERVQTTYTITFTADGNYTGTPTQAIDITVATVSYNIGDTGPAGGKIFYENANYVTDGWRYLEAAPSDLSVTYKWGDTATSVTTGTAIGTGKSNTAAIVEALDGAGFTEDYAAKACADYSSGGKDDWFLPSKDELNELYKQKNTVGVASNIYWSSSEAVPTVAWEQGFTNGYQSGDTKGSGKHVRAVRAF